MEKIKQLMIKDQLANVLREEILSGKLRPMEKLNENSLCKQLDVSRTPLREAISILESEGLVETIPNRGSRVVSFSTEDIDEIYEVRILLESLATEKSVNNLSEEEMREIESIQEALKKEVANGNWTQVDILNEKFHYKLFSSGKNNRLIKLVKNFNQLSRLMRISAFLVPGRSFEVLAEHDRIIEAVKRRDTILAKKLIKDHMEAGRDALLKHIDNEN